MISKKTSNTKVKEKDLTSVTVPGIRRGEIRTGVDAIPVILPVRTENDLQASVDGGLIKNEFEIEVISELDSCLCCEKNPMKKIDVRIFNKQLQ